MLLALTFLSCTTTRIAVLTPVKDEKPELFFTQHPDKPYIELAYIQSDGTIFTTPQQLLNGLRKKAVKLNADAIIHIKYDFQAWYPLASGIAIKYK